MRTDTDIRNKGMETLITALGYVDAERFIMLMGKEPFDYTKWRGTNLDSSVSVRELSGLAKQYANNL